APQTRTESVAFGVSFDADYGPPLFRRPLWLVVRRPPWRGACPHTCATATVGLCPGSRGRQIHKRLAGVRARGNCGGDVVPHHPPATGRLGLLGACAAGRAGDRAA